jgi:imidazoleglycerol-phosphate dehydratase
LRRARIDRRTKETQIRIVLDLDGRGRYAIRTRVRFLDHMLELVARHGGFDLTIQADGDLDVDAHHTVEDVGITLGEAVLKALGTKRGINRAGYFVMPMDETLAVAAIDLSGRPHVVVDTKVTVRTVGDLQSELVHDFFEGLASAARANVHIKVMYGRSNHHKIEACFKAFARALRDRRQQVVGSPGERVGGENQHEVERQALPLDLAQVGNPRRHVAAEDIDRDGIADLEPEALGNLGLHGDQGLAGIVRGPPLAGDDAGAFRHGGGVGQPAVAVDHPLRLRRRLYGVGSAVDELDDAAAQHRRLAHPASWRLPGLSHYDFV